MPLNEALLLAMWLAGLVASAIAVYSVATYRLSARPVVALRTSRIAAGVAVVTLAGLTIWALSTLVR
ncbi:hypothetical protein ACWD69_25845 [Micromonospora chokoriensis]